jgi:hypothetical protein
VNHHYFDKIPHYISNGSVRTGERACLRHRRWKIHKPGIQVLQKRYYRILNLGNEI